MPGITEELESLRRENARLRKLLKLTDAEAAPAEGAQVGVVREVTRPGVRRLVATGQGRLLRRPLRRPPGRVRSPLGERAVRQIRLDARGRGRLAQGQQGRRSAIPTPDLRGDRVPSPALHIGFYPMLPNDQTCWLAADFDGQAAMLDALAYLKAARAVGAPAALEVSRSALGLTCGSSSPTRFRQ